MDKKRKAAIIEENNRIIYILDDLELRHSRIIKSWKEGTISASELKSRLMDSAIRVIADI